MGVFLWWGFHSTSLGRHITFPEAKNYGLGRENVKRAWHGSEKLLENFLGHENQDGPEHPWGERLWMWVTWGVSNNPFPPVATLIKIPPLVTPIDYPSLSPEVLLQAKFPVEGSSSLFPGIAFFCLENIHLLFCLPQFSCSLKCRWNPFPPMKPPQICLLRLWEPWRSKMAE